MKRFHCPICKKTKRARQIPFENICRRHKISRKGISASEFTRRFKNERD